MASTSKDRILIAILVLMALWAAFRLQRMTTSALAPAGSLDLHGRWYYSHFLRLGEDPYAASLRKAKLEADLRHFGPRGAVLSPQEQSGTVLYCGRGAPLLLAMFPLTFLSWPLARFVWLVINLAAVVLLPSLVLRLVQPGRRPAPWMYLLIQLALLCLLATSIAVGNAQSTPVTLALSLWGLEARRRSPLLSGIAVGIAISQPALALPFFVALAASGGLVACLAAIAVQGMGVIAISLWAGSALLHVLDGYLRIMALHIDTSGVNLTGALPDHPALALALSASATIAVAVIVWPCLDHRPATPRTSGLSVAGLQLLALGCLWYLLVSHHREYDAMLFIVFFAVVAVGLEQRWWNLGERAQLAVALALALLTALLSRPGASSAALFPESLEPMAAALASDGTASLAIFAATVLGATLLRSSCRRFALVSATLAPEAGFPDDPEHPR